MRIAFLILLLLNVGLFFWGQGYLGAQDAGREPDRLARQVAPEKLRILTVEPVKPPSVSEAEKTIQ